MSKSVLIIGAGIGGLAAGCYAQLNGYRTRILEMHSRPGGLCTSWARDGYIFDGCIHNLAGTAPDSPFHSMWRELGVIPRLRMRGYDELVSVERPGGEPLNLYTDLDRLHAHLQSLSPRDAAEIYAFISAARRFVDLDILGLALASPLQRARTLAAALPILMKWGGYTLESCAPKFSDPFLRRAFPTLMYDWPKQSLLMLFYFLGRASVGDLGWPEGGAQALANAIAHRFHELGGEIRYHKKVRSIIVENDHAVGVALDDGSEERADIIISNANGFATIFEMLGGRYTSAAIRAYYSSPEDRYEMGIHVCLGVARDLSAEPHAIVLPLDKPEIIAGEMRERLYVEPFGFDASLAPAGKSPLKVMLATSYRMWDELARDPAAYSEEKSRIAQTVIRLLEPRFPGIAQQVEVVDVATPVTTKKFTGNGHGYRDSIGAMIVNLLAGKRRSQTLPGLKDFYMVGQWAGIAGVPTVAAMGRDVIRQICRRDGRVFVVAEHPAASSGRSPFKTVAGEAAFRAAYDAAMKLWPVPYQEIDIPTRFGTTHVIVSGPQTAPPLVLAHGYMATAAMWSPNIADLSKEHRVYAIDVMGQPGKSIPDEPISTAADFVEWLRITLDRLQIPRASLIGQSYGGWLALNFAIAAPERLRKLVLLSPGGLLPLTRQFTIRGMLMILLPARLTFDSFMRWLGFKGALWEGARPTLETMYLGIRHFRIPRETAAIFPVAASDEELRNMQVPTLLLVGENEVLYDPAKALARARRLIPHCEGALVPQSSHEMCFSRRDVVDARVLEFLRDKAGEIPERLVA